jgi:hypothetical protein
LGTGYDTVPIRSAVLDNCLRKTLVDLDDLAVLDIGIENILIFKQGVCLKSSSVLCSANLISMANNKHCKASV